MKRDSVNWRPLASFSVIERPLAPKKVLLYKAQNLMWHIKTHQFSHFKAQSPQKRRNKKPRGGTMRKSLTDFSGNQGPLFVKARCSKNTTQHVCLSLVTLIQAEQLQPNRLLKPMVQNSHVV